MQIKEQIKLFCVKYGISLSELARRLNKSPQAFLQKLNRGTLSLEDIEEIAIVTDSKFECSLILQNGDRVILRK